MLTKNDLYQIRTVVKEEVALLDKKIDKLEKRLDKLDHEIKKELRHLDRKLKIVSNYFDEEYLALQRRVERLEMIEKTN